MSKKHFFSDPAILVDSALQSLTFINPSLATDTANKIVYRRPCPQDEHQKTAIVSGGGSGHEPSFSGLVGQGLLSAAVAGTIFASPSTVQVQTAITSRLPRNQDVLVIVMNYTGDILNFGVAVEKAKTMQNSRNIDMVVVADDVGVSRSQAGKVGRRGIAGTVLVTKIAGALATRGYALRDVTKVAKLAAENLVSVGASLDHVHVPGREVTEEDELAKNQVELGMGIHNEPGSKRLTFTSLEKLVREMLRQLLDLSDSDRAFLKVDSQEIVLLVNNLGGLSVLEMGGILKEVVCQLDLNYSIVPVRIFAGTYMTSLNGPGFSITLLNTVPTDLGGENVPSMVMLLDDTAEATGWSASIRPDTWRERNTRIRSETWSPERNSFSGNLTMCPDVMSFALTMGLRKLVEVEPQVTIYDTLVGDGDCGIGLQRGAEAMIAQLCNVAMSGNVVNDIVALLPVVEHKMDGTSGALYTIFLHNLVNSLRKISDEICSSSEKEVPITTKEWTRALRMSLETLSKYTPAKPGDRTIMDVLYPFVETLEKTENLQEAAIAAQKGAENTKGMKPGLGRSVYVGGEAYKDCPDPGAWGLAAFLGAVAGWKDEWKKQMGKIPIN